MSAVKISKHEVTVATSEFLKNDGYAHRINPLIRCLHSLRDQFVDKKLRVVFPDGEPLEISGFDLILKKFVNKIKLPPESVIIDIIDHHPLYTCDWATVQLQPSRFFQSALDMVNTDKCIVSDDALLFGGVYGRLTHGRLLMTYMLETEFPDDSYTIFQPSAKFVDFEFAPVATHFADVLAWFKQRNEHRRDLIGGFNGLVSNTDCLPVYHSMFDKYQIEIVIETTTRGQGWFTEKTTKCLVAGKPFLLYGTHGQLEKLRGMGFRTFDGIIDENYDHIEDDEDRFDAIQNEIRRLASINDRSKLLSDLKEIAIYNKNNYANIINKYYQVFYDNQPQENFKNV